MPRVARIFSRARAGGGDGVRLSDTVLDTRSFFNSRPRRQLPLAAASDHASLTRREAAMHPRVDNPVPRGTRYVPYGDIGRLAGCPLSANGVTLTWPDAIPPISWPMSAAGLEDRRGRARRRCNSISILSKKSLRDGRAELVHRCPRTRHRRSASSVRNYLGSIRACVTF